MSTALTMIVAALLEHRDDSAASHASGSFWMMASTMAFSMFLLAYVWALLRPRRVRSPTAAEIASERFARGEIDSVEFERIVKETDSRQI